MVFAEIMEELRRFIGYRKPYVSRRDVGRWTIRYYDPVLRRWTDNGQTFFNRRDAELRLKESPRKKVG
jgi:hypothetical protein